MTGSNRAFVVLARFYEVELVCLGVNAHVCSKKTGSASGNARICFAVHLWSLYGIYENQSFENQNLEFFWDFRGNWSVENHRLVHCLSF